MQVETSSAAPFPSLSASLPSHTIRLHVEQPSTTPDVPDSPTSEIPDLPKNAYGLESFADYCAAVNRAKVGLPAKETIASPDITKPIIINGVEFKYWNPDHPESEISDTDSETTTLQPTQAQNGTGKSTWSAGSPRKSILRQSTSLPPVSASKQPLLDESQNQLVYDYASSASPSSRHTSRLSSRRVSIDAGVQSEPMEVQNNEEEVVRVAAAKRLSARRTSIVPVKRGSCVHGLAGFTGVGRADSGAVICVANGKKFELVVHSCNSEDGNDIAVQCSGIEIDSEIEALFGQKRSEEFIDVDAEDENPEPGDRIAEQTAVMNGQENGTATKTTAEKGEEPDEVPSPEQLRSNSVAFNMMTPIAFSSHDEEEDVTCTGTFHDEIVATSALTSNKRLIPPPTSTPKARVSAPPRITASQPAGGLPESHSNVLSPDTAPPAVRFDEQPRQTPDKLTEQPHKTPVQAVADLTNTRNQSVTLGIVRQRSLSLKPTKGERLIAAIEPVLTVHGRALHIGAVRGVDIHPTASAYQLAAMATLSPRSYLRAIQPSQSRIVFAFTSPGGSGPVRGVNVAPPDLMTTPAVGTIGVVRDPSVRGSLAVAPRRSRVSMPRVERTPSCHGIRASAGAHKGAGSSKIGPTSDQDTETLVTPAPLQRSEHNLQPVPVNSQRTQHTSQSKEKHTTPSRTGSEANKASSSAFQSQGIDESHTNVFCNEDDDFDALPDMDDDFMEIEPHIEPSMEISEQETGKEETVKRSRKTSMASSKTHGSRKTKQSKGSEQRRSSSVTQVVKDTSGGSSDADFSVDNVETTEIVEPETEPKKEESVSKKKPARKSRSQRKQTKKGGQKATKRTGQKRWRELKSLPTHEVSLNEEGEEGGLRRSKRQRFPRLKFWKNETVSYERRLSQAIPTIAEVFLEVGGSESSDDDTWFGRR